MTSSLCHVLGEDIANLFVGCPANARQWMLKKSVRMGAGQGWRFREVKGWKEVERYAMREIEEINSLRWKHP